MLRPVRTAIVLVCLAAVLAAWGRPAAMGLVLPVLAVGLWHGDRAQLARRFGSRVALAGLTVFCVLQVGVRVLEVEQGLLAWYSAPNSPPEGERSVAYRHLADATRIDRVLDFDEEAAGPFSRRFPLSFMNRRLHSVRGNRTWRAVELTDRRARDSFLPSPRVRPVFEASWTGFLVPIRSGPLVLRVEGGRSELEIPGVFDAGFSEQLSLEVERGVPVPIVVRTAQDASQPTRFALRWLPGEGGLELVPATRLFPERPSEATVVRARLAQVLRLALLPFEILLALVALVSLFDPRRLSCLRRGFLLVFGVALGLRLAVHLAYFAQPHTGIVQSFLNDDWIHMGKAWDLIHKDWAMPPRAYYWAPLYRYFLVAVQMLVGESFRAIVLSQQVLGALTCAFTYLAAARAFGKPAGVWAGMLCAFSPFLGYWETTTYIAAFATCLAALALERTVVLAERGTRLAAIAAGLAIGVACLARPNLGLFLVFACVVLVLRTKPWRRGLELAGWTIGAALLAISPATIKNAWSGGGFVPISTNGPVNLYIGNNPKADGTYAGPKGEVEPEDYVSAVREFVTTQPAAWLALEAKKIGLLVGQRKLWPFYALGLAGWIVSRRRRERHAWPVTAMACAVLVVPIAFFLDDRFLLPAVPPLAVFSGVALEALRAQLGLAASWSGSRRRWVLAGVLVPFAAAYVWLCTPAFAVLNRARAPWNLGWVADWLPYLL